MPLPLPLPGVLDKYKQGWAAGRCPLQSTTRDAMCIRIQRPPGGRIVPPASAAKAKLLSRRRATGRHLLRRLGGGGGRGNRKTCVGLLPLLLLDWNSPSRIPRPSHTALFLRPWVTCRFSGRRPVASQAGLAGPPLCSLSTLCSFYPSNAVALASITTPATNRTCCDSEKERMMRLVRGLDLEVADYAWELQGQCGVLTGCSRLPEALLQGHSQI